MNGGCRGSGVHARRPSGARAQGPEDAHTFRGLRPPERKRARGARAATTARAGRDSPGKLVTETSPYRGDPPGTASTGVRGLRATRPVRPGVGSELGQRGLELQAAGRSPGRSPVPRLPG